MSKAYPSNLTSDQFELLSEMIPGPKPGGRPREVEMRDVLNAIFYILCEGCRWRALPGDFPAWQTVYTYFRNWRHDGTWVRMHDTLREWVRIEAGRQPSPSEAIIDSQSVKSAAGVNQSVGYDAGKQIKGRKRFMTVDTLGLVLRVWVTAASVPERAGGKQVLKAVKQMGKGVSRLHTIWADGGFDRTPFMMWLIDVCQWTRAGGAATRANQRLRVTQKKVGGRTHVWLAYGVSPPSERLRGITTNLEDLHLPGHDPYYGEAVGIIFDLSKLFKHPLKERLLTELNS